MPILKKVLATAIPNALAICLLSGCELLMGGGMNTVEPPSLTEENKSDSILNDLSPIRARDLALPPESESESQSHSSHHSE